MNDKLLYRIPEVAEHLSISRSKVYELLNPANSAQFTSTEAAWSAPVTFRRTLTPWPPLRDRQHHCETTGRTRSSANRSRSTTTTPCPPDIGSVSTDVPRRPVFLRYKDFALRRISMDKAKWWSDPSLN
jgi:hypothetical protein